MIVPGPVQPAPSGPAPVPVLSEPTAMQALAAAFTVFYVLIIYGRLSEVPVPIPFLAFGVAAPTLALTALSGGLLRAAQTRAGKMLIALTLWLIVCIPFSDWPGGSFNLIIRQSWLKVVALYFMIAGNITTFAWYKRLLYAMAFGALLLVTVSFLQGPGSSGRLGLEGSSLGNPNDFAVHLLMGVPVLFYMIWTRGVISLYGIASILISGAVFMIVLKTGSRAGLVTLLALMGFLFLRSSLKGKLLLTITGLAGLALAPSVVPRESWERYLILFGELDASEASTRQAEHAEASTQKRLELLKQSLEVTLRNPIFGVGPGMFSVSTAEDMKSVGLRAHWQQTHNSYTQIASESGLPAAILYTALLWFSLRTAWRVRKNTPGAPSDSEAAAASDALLLATFNFCVAAMFGNYAYMMHMPLLVGLAVALQGIAAADRVIPAYQPASLVPPEPPAAWGFQPAASKLGRERDWRR